MNNEIINELSKLSTKEIWNKVQKLKEENIQIMVDFLFKYVGIHGINRFYKIYDIYTSRAISCVYFIKNNETGYVKIGKTKNLHNRFAEIDRICKSHIGGEGDLIRVILCSEKELSKIERDIHEYYNKYNIRGEWYNIGEIKYDDSYFCDGNKIIIVNNIEVCVDFSYEEVNYELEKDLHRSIDNSKFFEKMYLSSVCADTEHYNSSKLYKFHTYMVNNKLGFAAINLKRMEPLYDTLKVTETDNFITLQDAYVKMMFTI